jgi:hypothetical protein
MTNNIVKIDATIEELLVSSDQRTETIREIERALLSSGAMRLPAMRLNNVAPTLLKRIERYSEELELLKDGYLYGSNLGSPLLINHLGNAIIRQIENSRDYLSRSDDLFLHVLDFKRDHILLVHSLAENSLGFSQIETEIEFARQNDDKINLGSIQRKSESGTKADDKLASVSTALDLAILELKELRFQQKSVEMFAAQAQAKSSALKSITFVAAGVGLSSVLIAEVLPFIATLSSLIIGAFK